MTFLIDFIVAFTVAAVLIPFVLRGARSRGLYDQVSARKIHTGNIPRLGGMGIFSGFLVSILITILLARVRHGASFPEPRFWVFLAVGLGYHLLGLADDLTNLDGRFKMLVQLILAILVVASGYYFRSFGIPGVLAPIDLGWLGPPLSVLWIVGVANAYNLLDGMDGMTGGVSFIAFGIWAAFYMKSGLYLGSVIAIGGAGAAMGFLFYNFPPASIFMGDSGSLLLGYLLAMLPIVGCRASTGSMNIVAAVTVCLLPILDTLAAILRRWRWKVSLFTPDRYHLHHKLLNLGFSNRQVLAYIYSACSMLGASVLATAYVDDRLGSVLMLGGWAAGILVFILLHFLKGTHTPLDADRKP